MAEESSPTYEFSIDRTFEASINSFLVQAESWIKASDEGANTRAVSYAALELRYAIEFVGAKYVRDLKGSPFDESDFALISSFKRMENRIYKLAGNQKRINKEFEFVRIMLSEIGSDLYLNTPKLGSLSRAWHTCSEHLHLTWPLVSKVDEFRARALKDLRAVRDELQPYASSLGWATLLEPDFSELRNRFVQGEVTREDVVNYIRRVGIHAVIERDGGKP